MFDFLSFFRGDDKKSKNIAKDRLKLVLFSDRSNCSPELLEIIKSEIVEVIKKHLEIDEKELDFQITTSEDGVGGKPTLFANIPIKEIKRK